MTNYALSSEKETENHLQQFSSGSWAFLEFLRPESLKIALVSLVILLNSMAAIATPYLIGRAVDQYISRGDLAGLQQIIFWLSLIYLANILTGFLQSRLMGLVSQNTLFRLRLSLFEKLQTLPIAFFNQNKAGDLMSRINSDTDKINTFLSESLIRFAASFFVLLGIGLFIFTLNLKLALVTLVAVAVLAVITQLLSPLVGQSNSASLRSTGELSTEIQQSLNNFKVIVAFNRQDYFRQKFSQINKENFQLAVKSGTWNEIFRPLYDFAGFMAQISVLVFGLSLVRNGEISLGLLIAFLGYTRQFYDPLRILGSIWASIQTALAAWNRVQKILAMQTNLQILEK